MPFATETGPMSSQPLPEISSQPQIASTASLFGYRARHWLPFTSTGDRWTFVQDRLRRHDIAGLFVQVPGGGGPVGSLRALSEVASDLRVPAAFLFRGRAPMDVNSWIDPRKRGRANYRRLAPKLLWKPGVLSLCGGVPGMSKRTAWHTRR